jgi:glycosyltransferase involved in cell wall biosynthesis
MPVHNAMPYLPSALASILNQTFEDYRVLVLDDASDDGSGEYLDQLEHPKLIVRHESRRGTGQSLNIGMSLTRSPLLARMDADDIVKPTRLADQVTALQRDPALVMIGTQLDFLVGDGIQRGLPYPLEHEKIVGDLLSGAGGLCPGTTVFKADAAESVGGYRIAGIGEDIDFSLRMTEKGRVANLPDVLYLYRLHGSSVGITAASTLQRNSSYARLAAKQRSEGQIEASFEGFCHDWERRHLWLRLFDACEVRSLVAYRRARIEYGSNHKLLAACHLTTAAALQPLKTFRTVRRIVTRNTVPRERTAPQNADATGCTRVT